jgi:light-regulated signal transduction histidine kinase (bacteriophytochrome)
MQRSGRRIAFQIEEGLFAKGDPRLLDNVFSNLIGNAWKFTRTCPEAKIEVGHALGDVPAFFVRDNGAGFDMAYAGRLFGTFQRLHAASEFEGHGIGLATVERIVRRHGGRIWAEGKVGGGATFTFTLG